MVIGILAADCGAFVDVSWRFAFGATPALALLQLLCAPYLLESPKWLLDRDAGSAAARSALRRLYGFRDAEALEQEVIHIIGDGGAAARPALRHQRGLLLLDHVLRGRVGGPGVGVRAAAGANAVATYVAIVLMDRRGRRELLMWSAGGMGASTLVLTAALLGLVPTAASLAAVCAFVSFFEIGLGPIPWLIVAEMFDGPALDAAQSAACQVNWACNFLVGLGFPAINAGAVPVFRPGARARRVRVREQPRSRTRGLTVRTSRLLASAVLPGEPVGRERWLAEARRLIEGVATAHGLSRADAFTLGGVVAIEGMGGPTIAWQAGRSDAADGSSSPPDGRLPDADKGTLKGTVQHLRDIFHRMGFDDKDIVALSGAHALGRCHETASGYWGPWTFAETTFSNEYFRLLLEETWTLKTTHDGRAWTGPDQFEDPSGKLMMLPSDVALLWDKEFRKHVEVYAKDEELFFKDFAAAFAKLLAFGTPGASTGLVGGLKAAVGL
ncbi:cytochrome-c peroxidase [Aureococcus anophagefferens]|nr:cytochrome-c peroxidase [Aureococcus anophagefferens]